MSSDTPEPNGTNETTLAGTPAGPHAGMADGRLRAIGHQLKPVVMIGDKGLTDAILEATRAALARHELIKVKVPAGERGDRRALLERVAESCDARIVQSVGRVGLLFRPAPEPGPLSNITRHALTVR